MAVDIKQLRIGAHVLLSRENKRVRIESITKRKIGYHRRADKTDHLAYARLNEIEPIPTTTELLAELGFKKREGGLIWSRIFDKNCYVSFSPFEDNCWSLSITPKDYRKRITVFVNNLHEAENIIWLTLHKELIEE